MTSECIDYRDLPGQNSLFLAYLYDFERVQDFYWNMPVERIDWEKRRDSVLSRPRYDRKKLVEILRSFNEKVGNDEKSKANLNLLKRSGTVAVVTGQQVGFMGGPSYAIYKAATALKITRRLRNDGIDAVPIFWLASDDSDFEEVRGTHFFDDESEIFSVRHPDPRPRQEQMAGTVRLDPDADWRKTLLEGTSLGREKGPFLEFLLEAYQPERNFREAFSHWLTKVFQGQGLILFDPLSPDYRKDLGDFYSIAVEKREELVRVSKQRKKKLKEAGFEPQVWIDEGETFLFWIDGRQRYKLEFSSGEYRAKGRRGVRWKPSELLEAIGSGEVVVGPNVLLRPILQDFLFPTVVGVAGPSEIAYYSQVNAISPYWNLEMNLYPRAAFTIVDRKAQRLLEKYRLQPIQVLTHSRDELTEAILRSGESREVLEDFDRLRQRWRSDLRQLGDRIRGEDPTVADMLDNAGDKIFYQFNKVFHRFVDNQRLQKEYLERHVRYLRSHLLPKDHLQERVVNSNTLLSRGGEGMIEHLIDLIQPDCLSHRLLFL